ncbi:condensin subunit Smc [Corynebacterium appendicis CIP 107643]|uniref:Chromosome partition protein Smc n=1 Tax=Corynebacterium appendicis CIP 107643 TaxID=1161099 RepID=A0A1N7J1M9_9CORY|nr:chromosome segregation protein SMC [Corynebacterium appendicis]WJY61418.1 Chromosome partition protein Smc [Corynebacterium appendicis CIP 107643]SIS43288.1 condensin subunit Smc [Corynebacterium appendicis CIP 107643]
MHLTSLTLKGFKSFASATTMKFEQGICAVVGPNGSGKSNVVDALAWVMGEQGAKNLRGGKMEDVIFAGAGDRKQLGRAEVTLTFDNTDGRLPIEYSSVAITRRMFRDGASEYEINGSKARLMDIQELLSDSGIGREMHIIVGQGKLNEILESRPEDRRAFIEEAAGVLKHRRRREKAQRKLTGMQANLDRLTDLTDELGKQLKPLARQAEAAQRAATVQADVRDARLRLAGHKVVALRASLDDASRAAHLHAQQVETVTEQLTEAESHLSEVEEMHSAAAANSERAQQLWFGLSSLAERTSATLRIATERASHVGDTTEYRGQDPDDLIARAERAEQQHADALAEYEKAEARRKQIAERVGELAEKARAAEAEHMAQVRAIADRREGVVRLLAQEESQVAAVESAKQEIARLAAAADETRARAQEAEAEAQAAAEKVAEIARGREPLENAHVRAAAETDAAEQRLEQLRAEQKAREKAVYSLSARIATLSETAPVAEAADVLGEKFAPVADRMKPDKGVEKALAAALGAHAEALAGDVDDSAIADELGNASRAVVVDTGAGGQSWRLDGTPPAGTTWLLDHVSLDDDVVGPITRILVDVVLADDVAAARRAIADDPRLRAVTPDGVAVGEGWLAAGSGGASSVEVAAQIEAATAELDEAQAELDELSGTFEGAKIAAEEARVAAASAKAALKEHDAQAESWKRDHQRLVKQAEQAQKQHASSAKQANEADIRLSGREKSLAETRDRLSRVERPDSDEEADATARDEANAALTTARSEEMEATLAARSTQQAVDNVAGRGAALRRQAEHERQAKARHDVAMARKRAQAELAQAVAEHARDLAAKIAGSLEHATQRRDTLSADVKQLAARQSHARETVSALRKQLARLGDTSHAADIAREQAQVRIDEAETKIVEQLGIAIDDLLADYSPAEDFDEAEEKKRLKKAEKDLAALGKVNPLALEEYKALEERYSFLSTQLADVVQARKDLAGVIDDVDKQILQLFTDAWHDVEREFPRVFDTLFPGGEARLLLTDPSDMLTTGIEIEARPPGKKVKRLSLLSGGEKSLTALAMLVAIFRARPSPFYVLDEVEAALDDVNLRRLIALLEELREDSQLIVITHQKPTMDVANVLYGVTMRGDGVTRVISQRMNPAPRETAD